MFPLTAKKYRPDQYALKSAYFVAPRVLPKLLRRPHRFFNRLLRGDILVPKYAEGILMVTVIGSGILYGSLVGGQFAQAVDAITAKAGLAVSEIEISGNTHTGVSDIFSALDLEGQRSLISIAPLAARDALRQLPWVAEARIAKIYPDKLKIDITERDAFAVWQQGDALTVIEKDGSVIGGYAADAQTSALPFLVGKGAAKTGANFIVQVARFDDVAKRVRAYIRVGTRRWDLRLDNGMTIRLPENDVEEALDRLIAMQAQLGILDRDLAAIDLRLKDRTVFALTENALAERDKFVKARTEAARKKRKLRGSRI